MKKVLMYITISSLIIGGLFMSGCEIDPDTMSFLEFIYALLDFVLA